MSVRVSVGSGLSIMKDKVKVRLQGNGLGRGWEEGREGGVRG